MADSLPAALRYIKNGEGGRWWRAALAHSTIEAGWDEYEEAELRNVGELVWKDHHTTKDYNALRTLIEGHKYLWITIEDDSLWWCTLSGEFDVRAERSTDARGHISLRCAIPWRNTSLAGRHLAVSELPGVVVKTAGFRGTVCEPGGAAEARRVILGQEDPDVAEADAARLAFIGAVERVVRRLRDKDFETLVDLIMARTGWARIARLGGTREGVDVEAQNAATGEIAYVQVKSAAGQGVLDDYVGRFEAARGRYARMIFAVHSPQGAVGSSREAVHVWDGRRIAELVVDLGLASWLRTRV